MGHAARIDPQQLVWTTQWYLRPEALAAASARIVNAHHALPLAQQWGGRFSSSDGKRYPVAVDSPEARAVSRYFGRGRGVTFDVLTSDQHTHYATRVVRTTVRDATYVLEGILDNQTELPIGKHTTDTAGYSDSSSRSSTSSACSSHHGSPGCPTAATTGSAAPARRPPRSCWRTR
jgi:TnpA family transposase